MKDEMPGVGHCAFVPGWEFGPAAEKLGARALKAGFRTGGCMEKPHSCVIPLPAERGYVALRRIRKKMDPSSRASRVVAPWGRAELRMGRAEFRAS